VLLAFTALASTSVALATELLFPCAGRKAWLMRPSAMGLAARRAYRVLDRGIPALSGVAATASFGLAVAAGLATRAGLIGLAGVLALGLHFALYAEVAPRFRAEASCLELSKIPPHQLAALQARWEIATTTRASLLAAAFVCLVTQLILA
jgi:hypothetical protein